MDILNILFWIFVVYFFIVFIGLRFVAPFMGFKQYLPPNILPEEIKQEIKNLEASSHDQESYLKLAYDLVMQKTLHRWKHSRFQAAFKLPRLFVNDLEEIWHTNKFIYCTGINFILYTLLANSKYFKAEDVKIKYVFLNFVLHQYLKVKVNGIWVDADPAGAGIRGKPLGQHASLFG